MPDVSLDVQVRSNVDQISARAIHKALVDLVSEIVTEGEEFMRVVAPRGETLGLERAISHTAALDEIERIRAIVGVKPVHGLTSGRTPALKDLPVPGEQDSSHYPLFVERGTGIFGPAGSPIFARRAHYMRFQDSEGVTIFRSQVAGQRPQHYVLQTYASMHLFIKAAEAILRVRLDEMKAKASATEIR